MVVIAAIRMRYTMKIPPRGTELYGVGVYKKTGCRFFLMKRVLCLKEAFYRLKQNIRIVGGL